MIDFSFVLPTRERPQLVKRFFQSLIQNTSSLDRLEIILYVDEDDTTAKEINIPACLHVRRLVGPPRQPMGWITKRCFRASKGRYVFLINDDVVVRTPQWDKKVLSHLKSYSDDIVMAYPNDLYYGEKMTTFPILSRRACWLMDEICPADYQSHCIDPHVLDIFTKLKEMGFDRYVYLKDIVFEHMQLGLGLSEASKQTAVTKDEADQKKYAQYGAQRQQIANRLAQALSKNKSSTIGVILYENSENPCQDQRIVSHTVTLLKEQGYPIQMGYIYQTYPIVDDSSIRQTQANGKGFISAINQMAQQLDVSAYVFLELGDIPLSGWLDRLLAYEEDDHITLIGSMAVDQRNDRILECGYFWSEINKQLALIPFLRGCPASHHYANALYATQFVDWSGLYIKRGIWQVLGGLEKGLWEQAQLAFCVKAVAKKHLMYCNGDAKIFRSNSRIPAFEKTTTLPAHEWISQRDVLLKKIGWKFTKKDSDAGVILPLPETIQSWCSLGLRSEAQSLLRWIEGSKENSSFNTDKETILQ